MIANDYKRGMSSAADPKTSPEPFADVGALGELVGYHLRRATNVMAADFARAMAGTGMRQVPFGILSVLAANPGIKQGSAGEVLGIQRANMVSLINQLVDAGLVDRQVSAEDRRAFSLTLTEKGRGVHADSHRRIKEHEAALLADLTDADKRMLLQLLSRIEAREN